MHSTLCAHWCAECMEQPTLRKAPSHEFPWNTLRCTPRSLHRNAGLNAGLPLDRCRSAALHTAQHRVCASLNTLSLAASKPCLSPHCPLLMCMYSCSSPLSTNMCPQNINLMCSQKRSQSSCLARVLVWTTQPLACGTMNQANGA